MKILLEVITLVVIAWVAGAETSLWCCTQPPVEQLPYEYQVTIQKAIFGTLGRIMPVLMPLSGVLAIALVIFSWGDERAVFWLRVIAAVCIAITFVTTLTINVPINNLTSQWQISNDFAEWLNMRARWNFFQGIRGGLFMAAFVLLAMASVIPRRS